MSKTIIGLFDEVKEAHRVVDDLRSHGFDRDEVTVSGTDAIDTVSSMGSSAHIPEQDMRFYQEGVRRGGTLVVVNTADNKANEAAQIMSRYNMVDIDTRAGEYRSGGDASMNLTDFDEEGTVVPVVEEELRVGKRQVQRGGVRVITHVTERPVEEQVNLHEERVNVERRKVDRPVGDADIAAFKEGSFEVTATGEEAVIDKQARVVEEVVVGKTVEDRTQTISDTVRRTDVDVQQIDGGTTTTGTTGTTRTTSSTDDDNTYFQNYYNSNLSNSGYTYDQYRPVFDYGNTLATNPSYRGKQWSDVESDARTSWEEKNPGTWEKFKDSVRYAWDRATNKA